MQFLPDLFPLLFLDLDAGFQDELLLQVVLAGQLFFCSSPVQGVLDGIWQSFKPVLEDIVAGAFLNHVDGIFFGYGRGDKDKWRVEPLLPRDLERLQRIEGRQRVIGKDDVRLEIA